MNLQFFGIGSAFNVNEGSCSAYIIKDKHIYIIDAGETTHRRLMKTFDLNNYTEISIIITHLHNDHIGSLGSAISDIYLNYDIKPNIVFPLDTIVSLITLMGVESNMYNFIKTNEYRTNDISFKMIETSHSKMIQSFGLIITDKDNKIYYSGDANAIPVSILNDFKDKKIEKIYQDVTIYEEYENSHLYYKKLLDEIPQPLLKNVFCMHLEEGSEKILTDSGLNLAKVIE